MPAQCIRRSMAVAQSQSPAAAAALHKTGANTRASEADDAVPLEDALELALALALGAGRVRDHADEVRGGSSLSSRRRAYENCRSRINDASWRDASSTVVLAAPLLSAAGAISLRARKGLVA